MKNMSMQLYIIIKPFFDIKVLFQNIKNICKLPQFLFHFLKYKLHSKENVRFFDMYPCLSDTTAESQTGKGHYFYQDIWALSWIVKNKVAKHVDVGSRIDGFVGQCSALCHVEYVDVRAVDLGLLNMTMVKGSILSLPYAKQSITSLSCLHVIEHIGLGRYGDQMDKDGSIKAAKELSRVLAKSGRLYIGVPIGRERVAFNAHRVFNPYTIIKMFNELTLLEFKAINDNGLLVEKADINNFVDANYSCGLFAFERTKL